MELKSLALGSKSSKHRKSVDVYSDADQISELPDEVLESILSHMTIRESLQTRVLSPRWKNLMASTHDSLDFGFGFSMLMVLNKFAPFSFLLVERCRYISRVNNFLNCHRGRKIKAFKVKFDLRSNHGPDIDSWIKFAITKKVERLEVDLERVVFTLEETRSFNPAISNCYSFPPLESLVINNIGCLTSLNLNFVDMTSEIVEYLLSNCAFLEYVRILNSPSLISITVVAPCPKLKHFEIAHCQHLKFVDIFSAENLVSLSFTASKQTRLCFRNVPDVSLGGDYCLYMIERFRELPLAFAQIEKLKIDTCTLSDPYFRI